MAGCQQLDQAVPRRAQPDGLAHRQQSRQAGVQVCRADVRDRAVCHGVWRLQRGNTQCLQHIRRQHAARFGAHAVQQHRQALARHQQGQQRREHRQLARTVVTGQYDHRSPCGGKARHARQRGVEESAHFLHRFALDAHGHAEGADFEVAGLAVENLAEQIGGLGTVQRLGAARAPADFFDVVADAHGGRYVSRGVLDSAAKRRSLGYCDRCVASLLGFAPENWSTFSMETLWPKAPAGVREGGRGPCRDCCSWLCDGGAQDASRALKRLREVLDAGAPRRGAVLACAGK